MTNKDKKLVNFSEDYELNRHLKKGEFRQTEDNRKQLTELGKQTKEKLKKSRLTHEDLEEALKKTKKKFD